MAMTRNLGSFDRTARFSAALVLAVLAIALSGPFAWASGIAAAVLAATSAVGTCPLYLPFGLSTAGRRSRYD